MPTGPAPVRQLVLVQLLGTLAVEHAGGDVSLDEVLGRAKASAFGLAAGLLALLSIPFVGLSTPFGLGVALVAVQMLVGRDAPWLPRAIRKRRFPAASLARLAERLTRWTSWLERLTAPRLEGLVTGGGRGAVALGLIVLGVGLALPLPIPGSNAVFFVPILAYAIGLLERDGLVVLAGHAATLVVVGLGVSSWALVARAFQGIAQWFT